MQDLIRQNEIDYDVALRAAMEEYLVSGLSIPFECRGIRARIRLGQGKDHATRARVISVTSCTGERFQTG